MAARDWPIKLMQNYGLHGVQPHDLCGNTEHLHHSGYMGFLVCVVRIVYLNLKSVVDGREKGPGIAPTPGSTAQPHDRELKAEVLAHEGHMEHVLFNNFGYGA